MDDNGFDLIKLYPLHMRMGIFISLVIFIAGFMFIPKQETKVYQPKVKHRVAVRKLPPQLKNIVKPPPPPKPKMPVAAKSDEEVEQETIQKTDFTGREKKEAEVEFEPPKFVPYSTPPRALNLQEVKDRTIYPETARKLGIEGTVFLELWIDTKGKVRKVILVKSLYPALDQVAVKMAEQLKFTPAMQRDKPVAVRLSFPYTFSLEK